jgi:glycine betaine catabolism A
MADLFDRQALANSLRATRLPLADARTLPAQCYTSSAIHALEQEQLFARNWLAVARDEDLPDPGSFVTRDIGAERILVVRGHEGALRAFYNVCRHRGSRLVEGPSGRLRGAIACPYHSWSYELDGRLRHAPHMDTSGQDETYALVNFPLTLRDGFVFVNLDAATAPLHDALSDLPDWSRFRLDALRRVRTLEYRIAANWKLVCENYSECYHCPRAHPQLDRLSVLSSGGFEEGHSFNGGPMHLRTGFDTLSTSGRSNWPRLQRCATSDSERLVHYYLVYPNLMLGIHPDYLSAHSVWPLSPSECRVVCEIFVAPEALVLPGFGVAEVIEFWDLTNTQDWTLCERVQRGVASRGYRSGPYAPSERCVHAFDRWYAGWLAGVLDAQC